MKPVIWLFVLLFSSASVQSQTIDLGDLSGGPCPCDLPDAYEDLYGTLAFPQYEFILRAVTGSGSAPYSWDITTGSLPPAVNGSAQGVNNEEFRIYGIPENTGAFTFSVTLSNQNGTGTPDVQEFRLYVYGGLPMEISPATDFTAEENLDIPPIDFDASGSGLDPQWSVQFTTSNPGNFTIEPTTGVFTGKANPGTADVYPLVVTVEDNNRQFGGRKATSSIELQMTVTGGISPEVNPIDLVFVLDASGSMNSDACLDCNFSRFSEIKSNVPAWIDQFPGFAGEENRLGVVYFKTGISGYSSSSDQPATNGGNLYDAETYAVRMRDQVRNLSDPSWSDLTNMGGGLYRAIEKLKESGDNQKHIILFTDGKQNVPPEVGICKGDPTSSAPLSIHGERTYNLNSGLGVKIHSIGIHANDDVYNLLSKMAMDTEAEVLIARETDFPYYGAFFTQEFVNGLKESSPQLIGYRYVTMSSNTSTESFMVNRLVDKLIFKLKGEIFMYGQADFYVEKDSETIQPNSPPITGPDYKALVFDINELNIDPVGEWKMKITGTSGMKYEASLIADDHRLH